MADIVPPPRITGNVQSDYAAVIDYMWALYRAFVPEGLLAGNAPETTLNDLPDPASTNLAQAQQTANQAFTLASQANDAAGAAAEAAGANFVQAGQATVSESATTWVLTFDEEEEDTDFFVAATPAGYTGTPASADSFIVIDLAKTTADVTGTVNAAPGAGASVTFDICVFRN